MINKYAKLTLLSLSPFFYAHAQSLVDCRVVTGDARECKQYGSKLLYVKEIGYEKNINGLIISKTQPVPQKTKVKVISVEEMLEKHLKIEDSLRFRGTEPKTPSIRVLKAPVLKKVLEDVC